jgi:tRNA A22 N-methylase
MYKGMDQTQKHLQTRKQHIKIRQALRERFENIYTMRLTELVAKFYDVVKVKGSECHAAAIPE